MPVTEFISLTHGFLGIVFLMAFSGAIVALYTFKEQKYLLLKYSILAMMISVIVIDILGATLYIEYRAPIPTSPRSLLKASDAPWVHNVLMEFKEFSGIYVAFLMILINYLVSYYKVSVLTNPRVRNSVTFLLLIAMLWTLATFGLGAYITKEQPL